MIALRVGILDIIATNCAGVLLVDIVVDSVILFRLVSVSIFDPTAVDFCIFFVQMPFSPRYLARLREACPWRAFPHDGRR